MSSNLTVASDWYRAEEITPTITRIDEPHVHELLRANIWHLRGRDRDLVVDAGLGMRSLREQVPTLFERDPILVLTHAHLDHVGSAYEFADRRMHPLTRVDEELAASLRGRELARLLGLEESTIPDLPEWLIDALPTSGYDPADFAILPAPLTTALSNGELIELGGRTLRVLHLPGHTPGSICLFDDSAGELFSGDVIYDDILLDELDESNIADYVRSMIQLRALPVSVVYPGHGDPFSGERMREIIDAYLRRRALEPIDAGDPRAPAAS
jgi:glyoxylase-like metal-dependent hydrolase (beta-lactamase superfamily II)